MANTKTNRKPSFGNKRSHALNITKKKWGLNKQKVNVNGKTVVTTAREAKKAKKTKKGV
jgi:large subunit ribosomal protein L28